MKHVHVLLCKLTDLQHTPPSINLVSHIHILCGMKHNNYYGPSLQKECISLYVRATVLFFFYFTNFTTRSIFVFCLLWGTFPAGGC